MDVLLGFLFFISFVVMIVGLINPKWVIRWGQDFSRKKVLLTYGIAAVAFVAISVIFSPPSDDLNNTNKSSSTTVAKKDVETEEVSPIKTIKTKVTRVVDGDTIEVNISGQTEKVRLIGVDTPETKHPSKPVQPYGPEAENYTHSQLEGKIVWLEKDVQELDKYNRVLAYVWLAQPSKVDDSEIREKLFNAKLLLDGYGQLLTIPPDVKYVDYFTKYQTEAKKNNKGLWAAPAMTATTLKTTATTQKSTAPQTYNNGGSSGGTTVYITNTGKKYHRDGCSYLKSKIPISLSDAKAQGYTPCSRCNPPN